MEQYEDAEWQRVWHESNGRVCGLLTVPPAIEHRSRRAVLFGALLTAVSPLLAESGRARIRVLDSSGLPLADVSVSLRGKEDKITRSAKSAKDGVVVFTGLPMGESQFKAECPGFQAAIFTITLSSATEISLDITLKVGPFRMGIIVEPVK